MQKFGYYSTVILLVMLSFFLIMDSVSHIHQDSSTDYYKILELDENCSQEDVKKAFRRLAKKYHPDKCKEPDAQEKFQKMGEAHEILSDPEKRREYDQRRKYGGTYEPNTSFNFRNFNFDDLFGDFEDFEDFQGPNRMFGGSHFKIFSDVPNFSDSNSRFQGKADRHKFGGGNSYFGEHFSGGGSQHQSRGCRTVTRRVGNTITTYTTCN